MVTPTSLLGSAITYLLGSGINRGTINLEGHPFVDHRSPAHHSLGDVSRALMHWIWTAPAVCMQLETVSIHHQDSVAVCNDEQQ
jgi:hypothetical protein